MPALAYDYEFSGGGNGEFYSSSDGTTTKWVTGSDTGAEQSARPYAQPGAEHSFSADYIAPSSGTLVYPDVWASDRTVTYNDFTLPEAVMETDCSIGHITIGKIGLSVKVYEGESLENMTKGVGHFKSTSSWDGSIGLCSHNRSGYFGRLKELGVGDSITYKTILGERAYKVAEIKNISETDFSPLSRSQSNILIMITCIENVPTKRLCVIAHEAS